MDISLIDDILNKHKREKSKIIGILRDAQEEFHYLPKEALVYIAKNLQIPLSQIYSLATFYRAFSLKPRGKHLVTVCLGTACHVRGGARIAENLKRELNIEIGETTKDGLFTLETVNCLGACALGPLTVIDGKYYGHMSTSKIGKIIKTFTDKSPNEKDKQ